MLQKCRRDISAPVRGEATLRCGIRGFLCLRCLLSLVLLEMKMDEALKSSNYFVTLHLDGRRSIHDFLVIKKRDGLL